MSSRTVRWLHLSGIHSATDGGENAVQKEKFRRLISHVYERVAAGFRPDLLLIAGDIANNGSAAEYETFRDDLLTPLLSTIGESIEERTFLVPGNHDVNRATRPEFDRTALLERNSFFFRASAEGLLERELILPRFRDFRDNFKSFPADWLGSEAGCGYYRPTVDGVVVGIVPINTAWLSKGDDDAGRLTPGLILVEQALRRIKDADLRVVLGHHPIEMFEPDDQDILRQLFRQHRVIYIQGHSRHESAAPSTFDEWPIIIRGQSLIRTAHDESSLGALCWGQFQAQEMKILIQRQRWVSGTGNWEADGSEFPRKVATIDQLYGPWWGQIIPAESTNWERFDRPLYVPIHTTRYTRRTANGRIVYEHAQRAGDKDVGEEILDRGPMLVDEALGFFNHVLLLGASGSGRSFAINRLFATLTRALNSNDPTFIRESYPDWRHAPLPMPFRVDAPSFSEWLAQRPVTEELGRPPLMRYAAANPDCCPERSEASIRAHCYRESFVILVDDWHLLSPEEAGNVKREIKKMEGIRSRHLPAIIYSALLDSSGYENPFRLVDSARENAESDEANAHIDDFELVNIADIDSSVQQSLIARFCLLHGADAGKFQSVYRSLEPFLANPGILLALLKEWQSQGCPETLASVSGVEDLHLCKLFQVMGAHNKERELPTVHAISTLLLEKYREDPSVRLLKINVGTQIPATYLEGAGFLKRHEDGKYSIRSADLQDFLVGWRLADSEEDTLPTAVGALIRTRGFRREPVKAALLWTKAKRPGSKVVDDTLAVLLLAAARIDCAAAAADFIIESGLRPSARILPDARQRFTDGFKYSSLSSLDRFIMGRALAICGDSRRGTGLDQTGSIPDIDWISIEGGTAFIGQTNRDIRIYNDIGLAPDDEPSMTRQIQAFRMSRFPVTNVQFDAFILDRIYGYNSPFPWSEGRRPSPRTTSASQSQTVNHPVASVSWDEAKAYCRWYTKISGCSVNLPQASQWEYAARGKESRQLFPWGDETRKVRVNSQEEGLPGVTAVGAFPDSNSPFHVSDMAGNVFEWCDDEHEHAKDYKITKGGSYNHDLARCRDATQGKKHRSSRQPYLGFRLVSTGEPMTRKRVILAGGGFSGTCTAIRLLALADEPLEILIVERNENQVFGGLPYGSQTAHWEHFFNLQAGRISLYREDRDDFVKWTTNEAVRNDWPEEFKANKAFLPGTSDDEKALLRSNAVPRRLYQQYLEDRIRTAVASSHPRVTLRLILGEVVNAFLRERKVTITSPQLPEVTLSCDQLVLCTGNLQDKRPPFLEDVVGHSLYLEDQYSEASRIELQKLGKKSNVLVLGSGLRACDVVMTLRHHLSELRREGVSMTLLSRNGRLHPRYPKIHEHKVIKLPRPLLLESDSVMSADEFVEAVRREFEKVWNLPQVRAIDPNLRRERILKAWEPYVPQVIRRLTDVDLRALLEKYKSLITVFRIGVVPEIALTVEHAMHSGCELVSASVESIEKQRRDFRVTYKEYGHVLKGEFHKYPEPRARTRVFDLIVNCMGREQDYGEIQKGSQSPIWRALLDSGAASIHARTRVGVNVDLEGMLVGVDGMASEWIGAVGVMREGVEFERLGRLGSFSFTLGPLKNQALEMAVNLRRRLTDRPEPRSELLGKYPQPNGSDVEDWIMKCISFADKWLLHSPQRSDVKLKTPLRSVWELAVDRLTTRTYEGRNDSLSVRIQAFLNDIETALAEAGVAAEDDRKNFISHFVSYLEALALAHLTRLDEVQPGEDIIRVGEKLNMNANISPKSHVVILYSGEDRKQVERLAADLEARGEEVWWDEKLNFGDGWEAAVNNAMDHAYAIVLCYSATAAQRHVSQIHDEARYAIKLFRDYRHGERFLFPIRFSECEIPREVIDENRSLHSLHWADFFPETRRETSINKLVENFRTLPYHPLFSAKTFY